MQPEDFLTESLNDARIARVLHAAVEAVDPARLVAQTLRGLTLAPHRRVFLLGLGKAAGAMTRAAAASLGRYEAALVITKHDLTLPFPRATVLQAGHPVPDSRSIAAGEAALHFVSQPRADDLLVCLISGGGSALATAPAQGLTLEDLQQLTSAAMASGAGIEEVNVLRRQLDALKGGGLAARTGAAVLSLILSDVLDDRLEAIASGPTASNPTGPQDALAVIRRFGMQVPPAVERVLRSQAPTKAAQPLERVTNIVIGNAALAATAALSQARREGFAVEALDFRVQGEARIVGAHMASELAAACVARERPFCMLAAGETTVTHAGVGKGGRNQELALAAVDTLGGVRDCLQISLATDGNDGPTDAAGAVASGASGRRAAEMGMLPNAYLERHDSYLFFDALRDLLKPGPTGTNVNDLILLAGL
jgi:hydroxypyruvate reductase